MDIYDYKKVVFNDTINFIKNKYIISESANWDFIYTDALYNKETTGYNKGFFTIEKDAKSCLEQNKTLLLKALKKSDLSITDILLSPQKETLVKIRYFEELFPNSEVLRKIVVKLKQTERI